MQPTAPTGFVIDKRTDYKLNRFVVAYGLADSAVNIAARFDLIDTYLEKAPQVQAVKVLNPNARAIFYENALTHAQDGVDWAVRDAATGSRIVNKDWGWVLMDFSREDYRASIAAKVKTDIEASPVFDGVFLDDVWPRFGWGALVRESTGEAAVLPQALSDSWRANTILLLQAIKTAIGSKLLIINTGAFAGDEYLDACDGQMYEGFGHPGWAPTYSEYYTIWKDILDEMIRLNARGKIYLAQGGVLPDTSVADKAIVQDYCEKMFMLGAHKNAYYGFATDYQGTPEWFPSWDMDLGNPKGPYTGGTTVYQREFDNGTIVFDSTPPQAPVVPAFQCSVCGLRFGTQIQLDVHTLNVHPVSPPQPGTYRVNDFTFYPVPPIEKPPKGGSYIDPLNGLTVTRITDALIDLPGGRAFAQSGYPKYNIENANRTKLMVQTMYDSCWCIWNAQPPYGMDHSISPALIRWGNGIDFRWDNTDPDIGYYTIDNKLMRYNIVTRTATLIHDFAPDLPALFPDGSNWGVTMCEEGDASDDRRYWAYGVVCEKDGHWWWPGFLVYDRVLDRVISSCKQGDPQFQAFGDISTSPTGNFIVLGNAAYVYPRDLSRYIAPITNWGHSDLGISREGREVLATADQHFFAMADLETGQVTQLHPIPANYNWGYHVSANSHRNPGWMLFSHYAPAGGIGTEKQWTDHEIMLVELTTRTDPPPRIIRIAQTRTNYVGYIDMPFAKLNYDGSAVYFGSGWGKAWTGTNDTEYDLYRVDIPADLYEAF